MKFPLSLLLLFISVTVSAKETVTVCQSEDLTPVAGASVISSNGLILGSTDADGQIQVSLTDYPLSVRCLGYEAYTVPAYSDTIRLEIARYSLPEVVVSMKERPITRVLTYVREYSTGAMQTDTMQLYNEFMFEYFFADGKVKGYKKSDRRPAKLNERRYGRIVKANETDSVFRPSSDDDITILSFADMMAYVPFDTIKATEPIRNGALSDTIAGKYSPEYYLSMVNDKFIVEKDCLSSEESHSLKPWVFKLLGMTLEITDARILCLFNENPSWKYWIYDYLYSISQFRMTLEGKLFKWFFKTKSSIGLDCYIEQYPVDIERLTVDEYKARTKDRPVEEFRGPDYVLPLAPAIQTLIEKAN